ncbi:MAG: hypothetical protein IPH93_02000 [Saprospiraceae bacterium]|nr:hypothetical protein [Saprospiraceae bacterium]MBK7810272.1 hypothetical protein [Saprospiraceae bacterium]MBK9629875.1 hypothetical protein [Saprospiraceae bacterium]
MKALVNVKIELVIVFIILLNILCSTQLQAQKDLIQLSKKDNRIILRSLDGYNFYGIKNIEESNYYVYKVEERLVFKLVNISDTSTSELNFEAHLPDSVLYKNDFEDICFLGGDSTLLLFHSHLVLISRNRILNVLKINQRINGEWPHLLFTSFKPLGNLVFDKVKGEVYLRVGVGDEYIHDRKFWNESILAKYKLSSSTIEILPVNYPILFQEKYLGDRFLYQICKIENEIYISFLVTNNYYKIQLENAQIQQKEFPLSVLDTSGSKYFEFGMEVPINQGIDNITLSPIYDNVIPITNKKCNLRFFRSGIPLKNSDGLFNSILDKKTTILVISQENELLQEYLLPIDFSYNSYFYFVLGSKLYINNLNDDAANSKWIHFDGFEINELD